VLQCAPYDEKCGRGQGAQETEENRPSTVLRHPKDEGEEADHDGGYTSLKAPRFHFDFFGLSNALLAYTALARSLWRAGQGMFQLLLRALLAEEIPAVAAMVSSTKVIEGDAATLTRCSFFV